jgi:predicted polyphosphate/ATP-dependent NAD kinase
LPRLGLIVNPVAGLGGRVGLKGTDGAETVREALRRGARPVAQERADRALARLERYGEQLEVVTAAARMGADVSRAHGFATDVLDVGAAETTSAADTRQAAAELERRGVDLILFAGGDGTARDVVGSVDRRVPILGIPTGVKMHSGVFATSPEAAGDLAASHLVARTAELRDAEVLDLADPEDGGAGRVSPRLYALANVPYDRRRLQHPKAASRPADADLDAACRELAREIEGLTVLGPGTTTQRVLSHLGLEGSLVGIDAVAGGELVGRDLDESQLLSLVGGREARLVLGVVGGQGYLLGRGNQQLSPAVLRAIGLDRIEIVASLEKLVALDPNLLRVDTGDPALDRELCGYRRVRVAPRRTVVLELST